MTKSPMSLAREALALAQKAMPAYSFRSRRDFTQHQLFAILVLRQFLKTDYRGVVAMLDEWPAMRKVLGLRKVPHYSTLCYAHQRLVKKGASAGSWTASWLGPGPSA